MAIEVFNRNECKFLIDKTVYEDIQHSLLKHMDLDEYNREDELYSISNIYYDTKDNYILVQLQLAHQYL